MNYAEQSRQVIASLDPEEISRMTLGEAVYEDPWLSRHPLGTVLIAGETIHLGVELAQRREFNYALFINNVRQISHLLEVSSSFAHYAPSFTGLLREGSEVSAATGARGVLTEDLTKGGRYNFDTPREIPVRLLQKSAQLHFARSGPRALQVSRVCRKARIKTFYPNPFGIHPIEQEQLDRQIEPNEEDLTLTIPASNEFYFNFPWRG